MNNATLYGKGVFTTVAFQNAQPLFWDKHWRRLIENASRVGIDMSHYTQKAVLADLNSAIRESGIKSGRARITFSDEGASSFWPSDSGGHSKTSLSILTGETRAQPEPLRLTISDFGLNSRSPLASVKSCNYLDKLIALDEAESRGFHEAVMLNERGEITSAVMANIFWLKHGYLFTPNLATGCLSGTTREFVLESLACHEVETEVDVLNEAEAIFLTSAGIGIARVAEFDSRRLAGDEHPIVKLWPPATQNH